MMTQIKKYTIVCMAMLAMACSGGAGNEQASECFANGLCMNVSVDGNFQVTVMEDEDGSDEMPTYTIPDDDQINVNCQAGDNTEGGVISIQCVEDGSMVYAICASGKIHLAFEDDENTFYNTECSGSTYYCTSSQGFVLDHCLD